MKFRSKYWLLAAALLINFLPLNFAGNNTALAESNICPLAGDPPIMSAYRTAERPNHKGLDLDVPEGTAIYAVESGSVEAPPYDDGGYGVWLILSSGNYTFRYGHIGQIVKTGSVNAGDVIAYSDTSGNASAPHLHWEVRNPVNDIDPTPFWNSCTEPGGGGGSTPTAPPVTSPPTTAPVINPVPVTNPTPVSSDSSCHAQVLRQGTSSDCVTHLQNHLNGYGYGIPTTGYFGTITFNSVCDFQNKHGLSPCDGVVGPNTWNALHSGSGASAPVQTTQPSNPTVSSNSGQIVNEYNGLCLDVPGADFSNMVFVQLYGCNGTAAQRWTLASNGSLQTANNMCLDVRDGDTSNGKRVQIYSCLNNANQQWQRRSDQTIRPNINTNKCLEDYGFGTGDGAIVALWDCNGGSNQKWR